MRFFKQLQPSAAGGLAILCGGIIQLLAAYFFWPVSLVIAAQTVLLVGVAWILSYDVLPIFLEPFSYIREHFKRKHSFFGLLFGLFAILLIISRYLPSGPSKDVATTVAFESFIASILWFVGTHVLEAFTPLVRQLKRKPREGQRVSLTDIVTSMAIIITPTVVVSFFFIPPGLSRSETTPYQVFATSLLTNAFILAYLYLFIIRRRVFTWRQLGWRGVAADKFGRALVLFVFVATLIVIAQTLLRRVGVPIQTLSFGTNQGAWLAILAVVGITPITEELYFRGFLFRGLLLHHKPAIAYGVSAFLFALIHPPLIVMFQVFGIGLLLAVIIQETKSIWPGALVHALNNALVVGYLLYR